MLTEETIIGMVSVLHSGHIEIREDTIVSRDGVEIARTYHRKVLNPDSDLVGEHPDIKKIAHAAFTVERVARFEAIKQKQADAESLKDSDG